MAIKFTSSAYPDEVLHPASLQLFFKKTLSTNGFADLDPVFNGCLLDVIRPSFAASSKS